MTALSGALEAIVERGEGAGCEAVRAEAGQRSRRSRRISGAPWRLLTPTLLVSVLVVLPLAYLGVSAVTGEGGIAGAIGLVVRPATGMLLVRSLVLAVTVAAAATVIAVPLAWLTTRTDLPWRRFWSVVCVLPLVFPSYVGALVVLAACSPRGVFGGVWGFLGFATAPDPRGFVGAALVLTVFTFPYVYLTVRGAMRRLDPCLEDAARGLGAGAVRTWCVVVLPQLRTPIGAGALLVALYALSDFGAVSMMGYDTFTRVIYLRHESSFDRAGAATLSLLLVVLAVGLLAGERLLGGRGGRGCQRACLCCSRAWSLGRWRWAALGFCGFVALVSVVVPVAVLAGWTARGVMNGERFAGVVLPLARTMGLGLGAALLTVVAALPVACLLSRYPSRLSASLERLTYVGFALPGVVVAIGLAGFALAAAPGLYQSLALLLVAYVVLFLPQAVGASRSSVVQVPVSLEEASLGLGRGRFGTFVRVTLPLIAPGLVTGGALVFLTTVKELPATLLLGPIGHETLATSVWHSAHEAFYARASLPALVLVAGAAAAIGVVLRRESDGRA